MTYHLHTEANADLGVLTSRYFEGFTIEPAVGYWRATRENASVIEIVTDGSQVDEARIHALAGDIRATNHQTEVLIERYASVPSTVKGTDDAPSPDTHKPQPFSPDIESAEEAIANAIADEDEDERLLSH